MSKKTKNKKIKHLKLCLKDSFLNISASVDGRLHPTSSHQEEILKQPAAPEATDVTVPLHERTALPAEIMTAICR